MSAYLTTFSPAVPSGSNQGKNDKCCLHRGDGKECPLYTHNGTKASSRHMHKDHEAEWSLVLAAGSKSAKTKGQRVEALFEASGSTLYLTGRGTSWPVKTRGPPHGQGGVPHVEPTSHEPRPGLAHQISRLWAAAWARPVKFSDDGPRPGPAYHILKFSRPGPAYHSFKILGPASNHRPMASPSKSCEKSLRLKLILGLQAAR